MQLQSLLPPGNEAVIRRIALRQVAWCYCLGQSLRGLPPTDNLEELISSDDFEELEGHNNKPLALLSLHVADLARLKQDQQLETFYHLQLDNTVVRLCDAQGRVERIKSTVFPKTYRIFLHATIYLFVVTLSLKEVPLQFELPLLLAISAPFFLLEKSATHMQDPFENRPTDTAVTAIARAVEINLKQLLRKPHVPQLLPQEGFYLR